VADITRGAGDFVIKLLSIEHLPDRDFFADDPAWKDACVKSQEKLLGFLADGRDLLTKSGIPEKQVQTDYVESGHSHTLLGNFKDLGLTPEGPYPTVVTAPDGTDVLVVHAWKHTRLLGRLSVDFDAAGRIISHQGTPCLIAGTPLLDKEDQPLDPRTQEQVRLAIDRDTGMALPEADPAVAAVAGAYAAQVAEQGNIVVGRAEQPLPHNRIALFQAPALS
jgi:2',3'-cyclic-nucleotide 2'-phosphodiesterase (5'-nucleotidase family)